MKSSLVLLVLFSAGLLLAQPVSLLDTTNRYDYVVITVPEFVTACSSFKAHKKSVRDFDVLVVDTSQIFAEFNSSQKPEENIREFISYAGTYWSEPLPKYFLIAGNEKMIPNYCFIKFMDTIFTDYLYSVSMHEPDTLTSEFYVGRIPARVETELQNYFNKVIDYESSSVMQPWNYNALFYHDVDSIFNFGGFANRIGNNLPAGINKKFITTDSGNKDSLFQYINNAGTASLWLIGHGNEFQFGSDALTVSDLNQISNGTKYFFLIYDRYFTGSDSGYTLQEKSLLKNDGAVAALLSKGILFWGISHAYLNIIASNLYHYSLGEIVYDKFPNNNYYFISTKISYQLWGDPSLKIKSDPTLDVENNIEAVADNYQLHQNYPNPFNPATKISFSIPQAGNVELKVYDVLGNEIALLANKFYAAGKYTIDFDASSLSSGIYFYTLKSANALQSKKMVLLK